MYDMSLWELNACARAYNKRKRSETDNLTALAWRTANFAAAAMSNKLKPLKQYLSDDKEVIHAPAVTPAQQAAIDERFKERRRDGVS